MARVAPRRALSVAAPWGFRFTYTSARTRSRARSILRSHSSRSNIATITGSNAESASRGNLVQNARSRSTRSVSLIFLSFHRLPQVEAHLTALLRERHVSDPEAAARKLIELGNAVEAVQDGRIYIELINGPMLFEHKATPAEYGAGLKLAIERGWLELDRSGTFVRFTQTGADLFA
jgi:hypothetical protein